MCAEPLAEHIEHLLILRQHFGDEPRYAPPLSDLCQTPDEYRAESFSVDAVRDLDCDFRE